MEFLHWLRDNWFDCLQSIGIVAGLLFAGLSFRGDTRSRRTENLIELTKQQREIWSELDRRPELRRILNTNADVVQSPVMPEEERFIRALVLHLNGAFHAMKDGLFAKPEGLSADIRRFFSRPVAKAVWERLKPFQDKDFVEFVEVCLADN